ncbi:MAG: hypothetical protein CSA74_01930 [Rhodobacterales bacterium]|nr:MAG: hypothetical protein CSA74_01930 [Rhodobacterales bacterium]
MLTSELTITEYAHRRQVLERRADMRLAQAMRQQVSLREKLRLAQGQEPDGRHQKIRHWTDGNFVARWITLPDSL